MHRGWQYKQCFGYHWLRAMIFNQLTWVQIVVEILRTPSWFREVQGVIASRLAMLVTWRAGGVMWPPAYRVILQGSMSYVREILQSFACNGNTATTPWLKPEIPRPTFMSLIYWVRDKMIVIFQTTFSGGRTRVIAALTYVPLLAASTR